MRIAAILLLGALTGACETTAEQPRRTAQAQADYERALAGKTAGKAESCLPSYRSNDMTVIDEQTILFRDGRTTWVNHLLGSCGQLGQPGYAMVTRNVGTQLCRGDIATVTETTNGMSVGSCAIGDFIPYSAR